MCRRIVSGLTLIMAVLLLAACGGGSSSNSGGGNNNQIVSIGISPATKTAHYGETIIFTVSTQNTDYTLSALAAAGCTKSGNIVTCAPTAAGDHTITVTATANSSQKTATLTVPELAVLGNGEEGQTLYADETESEVIDFVAAGVWTATVEGAPAWASVNQASGTAGNNSVAVTLQPNDTGADRTATIVITAGSAEKKITVVQKYVTEDGTAYGTPEAVTIAISPATATVEVGQSKTFTVTAANTDYTLSAPAAAGCLKSGITVTCTPTTAGGPYEVKVTAIADASKNSTSTLTATVTPVVSIFIAPTSASVKVGESKAFTVTANNTGYLLVDAPGAGCAKNGNTVTCTPTAAGNYTVKVTADADATKFAEAALTATAAITDDKIALNVFSGMYDSFIATKDGSLWGAGWNDSGSLGLSGGRVDTFTQLTVSDIVSVSDFWRDTLTLKSDGSLWGAGDLTTSDAFTQVMPPSQSGQPAIIKAVVGGDGRLVLKDDGSLWVVGRNSYGFLGLGDTTSRADFTQAVAPATGAAKVIDVAAGDRTSYIVKGDGSLWLAGMEYSSRSGTNGYYYNTRKSFIQVIAPPAASEAKVQAVFAGRGEHAFVLKEDGSLWARGSNWYGELGADDAAGLDIFTKVMDAPASGAPKIVDVSSGEDHTLILKDDGNVWAAGDNSDIGHPGVGASDHLDSFTQVASDAVAISAGGYHSLIVKNDGTVWAGGYGGDGQLGIADDKLDELFGSSKAVPQIKVFPNTETPNISRSPQFQNSSVKKSEIVQATVNFTLLNTPALTGTWKVYAASSGSALASGVTVSVSGNTLTLRHATDMPEGTYYVAVTEAGKDESRRIGINVVRKQPNLFFVDTGVKEYLYSNGFFAGTRVKFTMTVTDAAGLDAIEITEKASGTTPNGVSHTLTQTRVIPITGPGTYTLSQEMWNANNASADRYSGFSYNVSAYGESWTTTYTGNYSSYNGAWSHKFGLQ